MKKILVIILSIITVLSIILIIALFFIPIESPSYYSIARTDIMTFISAVEHYFIKNNCYPTEDMGLKAVLKYVNNASVKDLKDPWGNYYIYKIPGSNGELYEILSYGEDGKPGGKEPDITSSDL
jgi:general secretion pathway protein G